jgi:AcrR family transcriptional regulator
MHTDSTHVKMGTKAAQSAATRAKLVKVARRLFAKHGYARVGTEEVVRRAGVTRGALYHQFADKKDLFRAVFEQIQEELALASAQRAMTEADPLSALRAGASYWLQASSEPEVQRICLLDAPAVLGWEEWREVGSRALVQIEAVLGEAMAAGLVDEQPTAALAHVLMGALDEAALYIAEADDEDAARAEVDQVLGRMIDGLRPVGRK